MAKSKNKYKYITVCYALTSPIKKANSHFEHFIFRNSLICCLYKFYLKQTKIEIEDLCQLNTGRMEGGKKGKKGKKAGGKVGGKGRKEF